MKTTMIRIIKSYALFLAFLLAACGGGSDSQPQSACSPSNLSACGGGGGVSGGTSGGQTTNAPTIVMSLVDGNGNPANLLTASGTLTAQAKVTNSTGHAVAGALVIFSASDSTLAKVSPSSNLTDANGLAIATVSVPSPSAVGAATIIGSATFTDSTGSTVTVSGGVNMKVGSVQNAPQSMLLVSISPADKSILIQGNSGPGRVQTAQVTFKVTDANGLAVANQKVNFAFQQGAVDLTFASGSAVSGQDGNVTAVVNSGHTVTVATVVATVVNQNNNPILNSGGVPITATSDQITVTNTVLNPAGITIAADIFGLEGRDVAGQVSHISVYLTDQFGGAITDGTAVTFTTNGGAIVGNGNSAMCTTVGGRCTVALSGQNPQPAASILRADGTYAALSAGPMPGDLAAAKTGIAIIDAATQLNGSIVRVPIEIAMSGSTALFSGTFAFSVSGSCSPFNALFSVADINGNMMPTNSALSISGAQNVAANFLFGNKIPNQPNIASGTGFWVTITPGGTIACNAAGPNRATGTFYITLTTPYGAITNSLPVTVTYPTN